MYAPERPYNIIYLRYAYPRIEYIARNCKIHSSFIHIKNRPISTGSQKILQPYIHLLSSPPLERMTKGWLRENWILGQKMGGLSALADVLWVSIREYTVEKNERNCVVMW